MRIINRFEKWNWFNDPFPNCWVCASFKVNHTVSVIWEFSHRIEFRHFRNCHNHKIDTIESIAYLSICALFDLSSSTHPHQMKSAIQRTNIRIGHLSLHSLQFLSTCIHCKYTHTHIVCLPVNKQVCAFALRVCHSLELWKYFMFLWFIFSVSSLVYLSLSDSVELYLYIHCCVLLKFRYSPLTRVWPSIRCTSIEISCCKFNIHYFRWHFFGQMIYSYTNSCYI